MAIVYEFGIITSNVLCRERGGGGGGGGGKDQCKALFEVTFRFI